MLFLQFLMLKIIFLRRGGPPISLSSSRLKRGSMQTGGSGDDSTTQDESMDGEENAN